MEEDNYDDLFEDSNKSKDENAQASDPYYGKSREQVIAENKELQSVKTTEMIEVLKKNGVSEEDYKGVDFDKMSIPEFTDFVLNQNLKKSSGLIQQQIDKSKQVDQEIGSAIEKYPILQEQSEEAKLVTQNAIALYKSHKKTNPNVTLVEVMDNLAGLSKNLTGRRMPNLELDSEVDDEGRYGSSLTEGLDSSGTFKRMKGFGFGD